MTSSSDEHAHQFVQREDVLVISNETHSSAERRAESQGTAEVDATICIDDNSNEEDTVANKARKEVQGTKEIIFISDNSSNEGDTLVKEEPEPNNETTDEIALLIEGFVNSGKITIYDAESLAGGKPEKLTSRRVELRRPQKISINDENSYDLIWSTGNRSKIITLDQEKFSRLCRGGNVFVTRPRRPVWNTGLKAPESVKELCRAEGPRKVQKLIDKLGMPDREQCVSSTSGNRYESTVISTYHAFGHEDEVTDVTSSIEPPAKRGLFSDDDDTDDEMLSQYAAANAQSTAMSEDTVEWTDPEGIESANWLYRQLNDAHGDVDDSDRPPEGNVSGTLPDCSDESRDIISHGSICQPISSLYKGSATAQQGYTRESSVTEVCDSDSSSDDTLASTLHLAAKRDLSAAGDQVLKAARQYAKSAATRVEKKDKARFFVDVMGLQNKKVKRRIYDDGNWEIFLSGMIQRTGQYMFKICTTKTDIPSIENFQFYLIMMEVDVMYCYLTKECELWQVKYDSKYYDDALRYIRRFSEAAARQNNGN